MLYYFLGFYSCPPGQEVIDGVCFPVTDCSISRCDHGYCVVSNDMWRCVCDEGWFGRTCSEGATVLPPGSSVGISSGAIAAIIVSVLAVICEYEFYSTSIVFQYIGNGRSEVLYQGKVKFQENPTLRHSDPFQF